MERESKTREQKGETRYDTYWKLMECNSNWKLENMGLVVVVAWLLE